MLRMGKSSGILQNEPSDLFIECLRCVWAAAGLHDVSGSVDFLFRDAQVVAGFVFCHDMVTSLVLYDSGGGYLHLFEIR